MAVYDMSNKSLAQYMSDVRICIDPKFATSDVGFRKKGTSKYPVKIKGFKFDRRVVPHVDAFIQSDGSVALVAYVSGVKLFVTTEELAQQSRAPEGLVFDYRIKPFVVKDTFNVIPSSLSDFEDVLACFAGEISDRLDQHINIAVQSTGEWKMFGTNACFVFDIALNDSREEVI